MRWVKPLDADAIRKAAKLPLVVTVEGGVISGGAGEGVLGELARMRANVPAVTLGIDDAFVSQGKTDLLLRDLGLDGEGIAKSVKKALGR